MSRTLLLQHVLGQPSWTITSRDVKLSVTRTGGQVAPVVFERRGRKIEPYSIAPWYDEKVATDLPPLLKVLRGDFFCLPFGANDKLYRGEQHPPHGETANRNWSFVSHEKSASFTELRLRLNTRQRKGSVDKMIRLIDGHNVVYSRHVILAEPGPMCFAHHAMIKFPDEPASGLISTSRFVYGQVFPEPAELPENRGYSILKPGAEFKSLKRVRTITGQTTDLSVYPARRGYEDIVKIISDPATDFAWPAVTFPKQRYVWFALKDPRVLTGTVLWISNGGRHYEPWNGRHTNVMGLEDATCYFPYGLAQSARSNPFSKRGYKTVLRLRRNHPLTVNYITGVAPITSAFDRVRSIRPLRSAIRLTAKSGKRIEVPVDVDFLNGSIGE